MARPPSHIFIVRHGSRLDSADKNWHLTSATPYDTPLTYGGFLQARQVGNHINSLLAQAKVDAEVSKNGEVISGRRRRFRIVIHTSPYLRCLQTSIAISSGLSQTLPESLYQPSDLIVPRGAPGAPQSQFKSALIRVDACLGEWLTPEYFESITPPPDAALMVANAKAELMRREDYSMYTTPVQTTTHRPRASTSSLWNSSRPSVLPDLEDFRHSGSENENVISAVTPLQITPRRRSGYVAPQPPFALSSRAKVPEGLVAHARDACALVDYPWDSMRSPLDFGDGGSLADEWSTMHKRFRTGLRKMVNWYATTAKADELQSLQGTPRIDGEEQSSEQEAELEGDGIETVVIIVSHGAGCNALMGAVTARPVLRDVGIAAISMAERRENLDYSQVLQRTRSQDPAPLRLVPVDLMYELKIEASTDHLRPGTSSSVTSPVSGGPSPASTSTWGGSSNPGRRGRAGTEGSAPAGGPVLGAFVHRDPIDFAGNRKSSTSSTEGSSSWFSSNISTSRRASGAQVRGQATSGGSEAWSTITPPSGLWSPVSSSLCFMDDEDTDRPVCDADSLLPDFDNKRLSNSWKEKMKDQSRTTMLGMGTREDSFPFAERGTDKEAVEQLNWIPDFAVQPPPMQSSVFAAPPETTLFPTSIRIKKSFGVQKLSEEVDCGPFGDGWGFPPLLPSESERYHDSNPHSWPASGKF